MWRQLIQLPGYNYCGLGGNPNKPPANALDELCQEHDLGYAKIQDSGRNPYFAWNEADERMYDELLSGRFNWKGSWAPYMQIMLEYLTMKKAGQMMVARSFPNEQKALTSHVMQGRKRMLSSYPSGFSSKRRRASSPVSALAGQFNRLGLRGKRPWVSQRRPFMAKRRRSRKLMGRWKRARNFRLGQRRVFKRRRTKRVIPIMARKRRGYYGRRRRRFYKRRRRYYSRRRPRYGRFLRNITQPRTYHQENVVTIRGTSNSQFRFWAPDSFGDRAILGTSWTALGEGSEPIVASSSANETTRAVLTGGRLDLDIVNPNVIPVFCKVYWCMSMSEEPKNQNSTAIAECLQALEFGWKRKLLDADEIALGITSNASEVFSESRTLKPWNSYDLMRHYKVTSGRSGWIQPGDTIKISYRRRKNRVFSLYDLERSDVPNVKGFTVVPLIYLHGPLLTQSSADDQTYANLDMLCSTYSTYSWRKLENDIQLMHIDDNKPVTAVSLVFPTNVVDQSATV